jgi:hypothetical protein
LVTSTGTAAAVDCGVTPAAPLLVDAALSDGAAFDPAHAAERATAVATTRRPARRSCGCSWVGFG